MYKVTFSAKAKMEFNDAIEWYEDQQDGLGKRFATAIKDKIASIKINLTDILLTRTNFGKHKFYISLITSFIA